MYVYVCMHVYVCMYVCMSGCMCVCVYVYVYVYLERCFQFVGSWFTSKWTVYFLLLYVSNLSHSTCNALSVCDQGHELSVCIYVHVCIRSLVVPHFTCAYINGSISIHMYTNTWVYIYVYKIKYVCMYACVYVCIHACIYVYMYICMYLCMHACMHVYMYVCMYVCR